MCQAWCLALGLRVTQTDEKIPALVQLTVSEGGSGREILKNLERCINKIITRCDK